MGNTSREPLRPGKAAPASGQYQQIGPGAAKAPKSPRAKEKRSLLPPKGARTGSPTAARTNPGAAADVQTHRPGWIFRKGCLVNNNDLAAQILGLVGSSLSSSIAHDRSLANNERVFWLLIAGLGGAYIARESLGRDAAAAYGLSFVSGLGMNTQLAVQ
jgi:hypothetical protein